MQDSSGKNIALFLDARDAEKIVNLIETIKDIQACIAIDGLAALDYYHLNRFENLLKKLI